MEIQKVYVKNRTEFGKQCIFEEYGSNVDVEIEPNVMHRQNYIRRSQYHSGVQHSRQFALHETQTLGKTSRNAGVLHTEGGWPKEINPRDEEATARYRRRVEKDDNWAPKLRNLFKMMEHDILQNGAVNIHQHYFDDMIPTELVTPLGLRTVNVFSDPEEIPRIVNNISWSPDSGRRILVSYCFLDLGNIPDTIKTVYMWQIDNPTKPCLALESFCPCVAAEFNPRDPSILAGGLTSGQVCFWDIRHSNSPANYSHRQFSHRDYVGGVKWMPTKSNSEFFSTSVDGRVMWWDMRNFREPTESLVFDLQHPNQPQLERATGVTCINFGPMVGTKFTFGMENGQVISGSRKAKSNAEKLALRFDAHYGPVLSVDRHVCNPAVFLTVGDWTTRIWIEDTKEGSLLATGFLPEGPVSACWNKAKCSVFYVISTRGELTAWDLLQGLHAPVLTIQLCDERLTTLAPHEEGTLLGIGNSVGKVFIVEPTESLQTSSKKDRTLFYEYLERCSKYTRAVDTRVREIKLVHTISRQEEEKKKLAEGMATKARKKKRGKKTSDAKGDKLEKLSRERSGKSVAKDKRRMKDEFPDLAEAEAIFFAIIQKEKEKLTNEALIDYSPSISKKSESKKPDKKRGGGKRVGKSFSPESSSKLRDGKDGGTTESKAKVESLTKVGDRSFEEAAIVSTQKIVSKEDLAEMAKEGSTITLTSEDETSRKPLKVCKRHVCKPRVCCWLRDSASRIKSRRKLARKRNGSKSKLRRSETEKDAEASRFPSMLMDGREGEEPQLSEKQRIKILREMLASPRMLTTEVERAKREIRHAGWQTTKVKRRAIVRKIAENRFEKRKFQSERDFEGKSELSGEHHKREMVRSVPKAQASRDMSAFKKEFVAVLENSLLESMEDKPSRGRAYLEEIEAARNRVYPRISDFHSNE